MSWLAAVALSAFVLAKAGQSAPRRTAVFALAIVAGIGATAMHIIGMDALIVAPAMTVNTAWLAAAAMTATIGSYIAMSLFTVLRRADGKHRVFGQMATATVLGCSLAAMHFISMMAVHFADGTVCLTTQGGLNAEELGKPLGVAAVVCPGLTMMTTALERRAERRAAQLDGSLASTRRELEYISLTDVNTGLPNRSVFQDREARQPRNVCAHRGRSRSDEQHRLVGPRRGLSTDGARQREGRPVRVAVNLSAHQLRVADLPERIVGAPVLEGAHRSGLRRVGARERHESPLGLRGHRRRPGLIQRRARRRLYMKAGPKAGRH